MSGYAETKETTVRLKEPYKIKFVPFAKGFQLEVTANLQSSQIDTMLEPDGELIQLIENGKKIIKNNLNSNLLRVEEEKLLDGTKLQPNQNLKKTRESNGQP